jgi:glycosyltransferase involved in cell wall biosynthesis
MWLKDNRPQVLAVPGWSEPLALATALEARREAVPIVLMSDSRPLVCGNSGLQSRAAVTESLKKHVMRLFNSAFVAGREHSLYLQSLGMPREKISLGFDVVDNQHFAVGAARARERSAFHRTRLGLPLKYFLLCSRLLPRKNIGTAIEAFSLFRRFGAAAEGWQLVVVGNGPLRDTLVHLAQERMVINDIQFRDAVPYEELPTLYGLAEVFILPSWSETWGLVVNEAMAAGLPVIVSENVGCVPELVRHTNGCTFQPSDVGELARLMLSLAKSDRKRLEMRQCSQNIIADWGLSRFADGILSAAARAIREPLSRMTTLDLCLARSLVWR